MRSNAFELQQKKGCSEILFHGRVSNPVIRLLHFTGAEKRGNDTVASQCNCATINNDATLKARLGAMNK